MRVGTHHESDGLPIPRGLGRRHLRRVVEARSPGIGSTTLCKQVHAAATQQAAIELLKAAGAKQGLKFSNLWLRQATSEVIVTPKPLGLSTPD